MIHKKNEGNAEQVKRNAKRIKKEMGIPHHQALEISAVEFGYSNFKNLLNNSQRPIKRKGIVSANITAALPNPLVLPYIMLGSASGAQRPNAKAPIVIHQSIGTALKELYSALEYNKKGESAISTVKSTLDDWIQLEYTSREELTDAVFFGIYYGDTDSPSDPWPTDSRRMELKKLLDNVRVLLTKAYHDCTPIQNLSKKLDIATKSIEEWPLNKQVKGLREIKGKIPSGTIIYLKKHYRKPAFVLSHDTINNLIYCYEDSGPATVDRKEITIAKNQAKFQNFHPMRLSLPYGKWHCEDGLEVLFNRDYIPIWTKDKYGVVKQIDPGTQVTHNNEPEYYFDDKSTPWGGDLSTLTKCRNILNRWKVENKTSILMESINDPSLIQNTNKLTLKNSANIST